MSHDPLPSVSTMFVYVTQISINLSPSCTHTQQVLLIGALVLAGWQLVETTFIPKSAAWAHAATMNDHRITAVLAASDADLKLVRP